jgi:hypothetical protein
VLDVLFCGLKASFEALTFFMEAGGGGGVIGKYKFLKNKKNNFFQL